MDFSDFGFQDQVCKAFLSWRYGSYLFSRFDSDYEYQLLAIHDFYVQVQISIGDNQIIEITHFKEGVLLDDFLKLINLYEITNQLVSHS